MSIHVSLQEFEEKFPWESETQKKGFQALCQDILRYSEDLPHQSEMEFHHRLELSLMEVACWFIQKDHESDQWYNERIGELDKKHTEIQAQLLEQVRSLQSEVEELKETVLRIRREVL